MVKLPMKPIIVSVFVLAALPSYPMENVDCTGMSFSEVRSLSNLPKDVVGLLAGNSRNGIANRNEIFERDDVILKKEENLPFRRFSLAGISGNRIFVAMERGGRGYSVELWSFEQSSEGWRGERQGAVFKRPESVKELLKLFCR